MYSADIKIIIINELIRTNIDKRNFFMRKSLLLTTSLAVLLGAGNALASIYDITKVLKDQNSTGFNVEKISIGNGVDDLSGRHDSLNFDNAENKTQHMSMENVSIPEGMGGIDVGGNLTLKEAIGKVSSTAETILDRGTIVDGSLLAGDEGFVIDGQYGKLVTQLTESNQAQVDALIKQVASKFSGYGVTEDNLKPIVEKLVKDLSSLGSKEGEALKVNVNDFEMDGGKLTLKNKATVTALDSMSVTGGDILVDNSNIVNKNEANISGASLAFANASTLTNDGNMSINGGDNKTVTFDNSRIVNNSVLELDNAKFSNAANGAIQSVKNADLTVKNSEFTNNQYGGFGAAIESTGTLTLDNVDFISNKSTRVAGAVSTGYNGAKGSAWAEISNSTFEYNESVYGAGAINVYDKLNLSNTTFTGNKVTGALVDDGYDNHNLETSVDGGGAIFLGSASDSVINGKFYNNTSTVTGGAISTRADWYSGLTNSPINSETEAPEGYDTSTDYLKENSKAKLLISSSEFDGNVAETYGGALYNTFKNTTIENSSFNENNAKNKGGAIYNEAVAQITFNGDNYFTNNKATNGGNDIWNDGVLNFNSGKTTFDGGIAGNGTINVADGATLDIGTSSVLAKDITFNSGSTLKLDIKGSAEHGYIKASNSFTAQSGSVLNPVLEQGLFQDGFSVKLFDGKNVSDQFGGFDISNAMYEFRGNGEGLYEVVQINKASDLVDGETSGAASAWTDGNAFTGGTQKEVADKLAELAQTNPAAYQEALKALTPGKHNIVQGATTDHTNQVIGAVESRLSGGCSFFCTGSEGRASGDNVFNTAMSWVQGLFNKSKLSRNDGFDSKSTGIALGFEDYINDNSKLGVGYAFTNTDVDSVDGRNTDIDTHTIFVYGEYKPSKWFINGYAGYNFADYDESSVLKNASYDVNSISLQAMTGYEMKLGSFDVTPQAGVRYMNIDKDAHTDSLDQQISGDKSDIFTGVAGVKVAKDFFTEGGNYIRPEVKLAATYDFHNDGANSVVSLSNGSSYTLNGRALARFGVETGVGVSVEASDRIELSAAYEGKFREDYEDHTGLLNFKYKF